jgi:hypothetical protein
MRHPKFLCPIIGCTTGYRVPLVIEFLANGKNKDEAKKEVEDIIPTIESRLKEVTDQYPVRVFIGAVRKL